MSKKFFASVAYDIRQMLDRLEELKVAASVHGSQYDGYDLTITKKGRLSKEVEEILQEHGFK